MKLAIVSPINEYSPFHQFTTDLIHHLGCTEAPLVIAPPISESHVRIPGYQDTENVYRISQSPPEIWQQLFDREQVTHLLVVDLSICNLETFGTVVQTFKNDRNKHAILLCHDTEYHPKFNYQVFHKVFLPSNTFKAPPGISAPSVFKLPCPNYLTPRRPEVGDELNAFKQQEGIPPYTGDGSAYVVGILDGKTPLTPVVQAIEYINQYSLVDKQVVLHIHSAKSTGVEQVLKGIQESPLCPIDFSLGHLPEPDLANIIKAWDIGLVVYPRPNPSFRASSSAIRLVVGSGTPLVTNTDGPHLFDLSSPATVSITDCGMQQIKHGIVTALTNYPAKRVRGYSLAISMIKDLEWSSKIKEVLGLGKL